MEEQTPDASDKTLFCSSDKIWCLAAPKNAPAVVEHLTGGNKRTILALPAADGQAVWPHIVRQSNAAGEEVFIGFTATEETMFSGGSGHGSHVDLYALSPDTAAETPPSEPDFTAPLSGAFNIGACFNEDRRARRDACSDEYDFGADSLWIRRRPPTLCASCSKRKPPPILDMSAALKIQPRRRPSAQTTSRQCQTRSVLTDAYWSSMRRRESSCPMSPSPMRRLPPALTAVAHLF